MGRSHATNPSRRPRSAPARSALTAATGAVEAALALTTLGVCLAAAGSARAGTLIAALGAGGAALGGWHMARRSDVPTGLRLAYILVTIAAVIAVAAATLWLLGPPVSTREWATG